jgi:hypothetical protein
MSGARTAMAPATFSGVTVNVTIDESEQDVEGKLAALKQGFTLVSSKAGPATRTAFLKLSPLPVYFGGEVKCEACWQPEARAGKPCLFLGDRMMFNKNPVLARQDKVAGMGKEGARGVPHQVYDDQRRSKFSPVRWAMMIQGTYQTSKISAQAAAIVVHEIGHLVHQVVAPDQFWLNKRIGATGVPASLQPQVSSYLYNMNNYNEFVAEVFAGLAHGKRYPADVMTAYNLQKGPHVG